MLGVHLHDLGEGVGPVALGLAGQTVHQIDADVVEARLARVAKGLLRLLEVVAPSDELQEIVVAGLHADGQAVDPLLPQELEGRGADGIGVAFDGDLGVETDIAVELEQVEDLDEPVRAVVARRAAAEIDRVHLIVFDGVGRFLQMGQQGLLILGHQIVAALQGEKSQ